MCFTEVLGLLAALVSPVFNSDAPSALKEPIIEGQRPDTVADWADERSEEAQVAASSPLKNRTNCKARTPRSDRSPYRQPEGEEAIVERFDDGGQPKAGGRRTT